MGDENTRDEKVMSRTDERRMKLQQLKLGDKNKFENEIKNKPG